MLIDWFTVAAQIVNFVILVVLLRIFLYKRIMNAIDARRERISSMLEEAENKRKQAQSETEKFRQKNRELEEKRSELLEKAEQDAEKRRKELTKQARSNVESLERHWRNTLDEQREQFIRQLCESAARQVCNIARRVLDDMADTELEAQVAEAFLRRVERLDEDQRKRLEDAAAAASAPVTITSAFELSEDKRRRLEQSARQLAGEDHRVEFEHDPALVCGIRLYIGGQALEWNIASYLDDLIREFTRALDEETRAEQEPAGQAQV